MIPERLTIEGLASYRERHEIDFAQLCSARLFGIFGKVGSGKSTILDAITLALYGETDRHKKGMRHSILNLNAPRLFIEFDFRLGRKKETHYRFVYQAARNSKQWEVVKTPRHTAYQQKDGEWEPIDPKSVVDILGLSYDNFRRTIIIPQGKFQEFLQLTAKDRTKMLQDIFGLDKYDLDDAVKRLRYQNDARLENLAGQLAQLQAADPEQLAAEQAEVAATEDQLKQLSQDITTWMEIATQVKEEASLQQETADLYRKINAAKESLKQLTEQEQQLQEAHAALLKENEGIGDGQALLDDYKRLMAIKTELNTVVSLQERVKKGQKLVAQVDVEIKTHQERLEELEERLKAVVADRPDAKILDAIQTWQQSYQATKSQLQQYQQQQQELLQAQAAVLRAINLPSGQIPSSELSLEQAIAQLQRLVEGKTIKLNEQLSLLTDTRKQERELALRKKLGDLGQNLTDGDPCPLCGAVHHPQPIQAIDEHAWTQHQSQLVQLEGAMQVVQEEISTIKQALARLEEQKKTEANLIHRLTETEQHLQAQEAGFPLGQFSAAQLEAAKSLQLNARKLLEEERLLSQKLAQSRQDLDTARINRDKYLNGLSEIEKQQSTAQVRADALIEQLQQLSTDGLEDQSLNELEKSYRQAEQALKTRQEKLASLTGALAALTEKRNLLQGQIQGQQSQGATLRKRLEGIRVVLQASLNAAPPRISYTWSEELLTFEQPLPDQLNTLHTQQQRLQTQVTRMRTLIEQRLAQQKERERLLKTQSDLELRAERLKVMLRLFRGRGFVDYVSTTYLKALCTAANRRFRVLTRKKLALVLGENNEFKVQDFEHGGAIRHAASLSGGQIFQASLCLALALAEQIRQQHEAEEHFFFMDEGFGSQDAESLQQVLDTLRTLRMENRVVGVISHVEALKQEIDVYLSVHRDERGATRLDGSWAE